MVVCVSTASSHEGPRLFFFFLVARTSLTTQHTWLVKDRWVAGLKILVSRHMTSQKGLAKISH